MRQDWISMVLTWPDMQRGCFTYSPFRLEQLINKLSSSYETYVIITHFIQVEF